MDALARLRPHLVSDHQVRATCVNERTRTSLASARKICSSCRLISCPSARSKCGRGFDCQVAGRRPWLGHRPSTWKDRCYRFACAEVCLSLHRLSRSASEADSPALRASLVALKIRSLREHPQEPIRTPVAANIQRKSALFVSAEFSPVRS